ncbi:amino acid adenylation domain-containing protein [Nocardia sp. 2]|uniref:Amino acid adenylation domain-containing protein n=1 Tax=Nocardia acididurans TaxID=2802282 RepID=A0ABS1M1K5_9NOCA|nr:non-ribosomal peptide synthetase/type I polyketide synthase [Nocardia acididurans]MBL1074538.1 amino acid adenylation domain-containing protein [Nocardia acididurans]
MADDAALRSYLTKATRELQDTRKRLGELEAQRSEPIAIVAMGCRYPGGIDSPDGLWEFVAGERCAVADLPTDRGWDMAALTNPVADSPGATYVRRGHFVDTAGDFDAAFFGISPREALAMDPQQRLLLETTWEALENGGIDPRSLSGSDTGVYLGVGTQEYGARVYRDDSGLAGHLTTGTTVSVASGRISYVLGLNGPAATIDTACSSSLTAIHLAVRALRSGETALAIAGGATVTCSPSIFVGFSRLGALAPDGVCKPFSADANGFGVAEGVGVLVLQRLSDAQRDGRPILAVIRGTAIGQDGASNGLSAPSGPAQQRVIRAALADAGLTPGDVDVVEAHGTGTTLGDPIEADALLATYGTAHTPDRPLLLGSMKANIGHAQAAAGVAGVIKMVEAMRHGLVPAIPGLNQPTSQVDWSPGTVRPVGESTAWPQSPAGIRRAGISAFGISGTNAHVIVEQAPGAAIARTAESTVAAIALPLSARTESALADQAARLSKWLTERAELDPLDVSFSLATGRSAFEHRAVVVGRDRDDVRRGLDALAAGEPSAQVVTGRAVDAIGGPVFVFPGQGSQWIGMAAELLDSAPVFADHIAEVERAFAAHVDWSLTDVLRNRAGAADLERVDVVQPALFAVMTSLAKLWESMGVRPAAVIGHSQGEIAAAYVAGALSLADAARVVTLRSKAITALAGRGGMVSVALAPAEVEALIEPWRGRLSIAAVNGPVAVVVSGDSAACDELVAQGEERGLRVRRIPVDYASHSAHVESISEAVHSELDGVQARVADVAFFSTVTGERISTGELGTAYWYRNLRQQVRFHAAVRAAGELGYRAFLEVSPHPVLTTAIQDALDESGWGTEGAVVESLRRDDGGLRRFLLSAGQAQVRGLTPDWGTRLAALGARRIALPTYAFQHKRYWITDDGGSGDGSGFGLTTLTHPMLAAALQDPESEAVTFTGRLGLDTHPWLADHAVHGAVLLPGAALTELALFAGEHTGYPRVAELVLREPLILPRQGALTLRVVVSEPQSTGARPVRVYSRPAEDDSAPWSRHAEGALTPDAATLTPAGAWPPPNAEPIDIGDHYDRLADEGYEYGPSFRGLRAAWRTGDAVLAEVAIPESASGADRFTLHPALLDAALHALGFSGRLTTGDPDRIRLPFSWEGVTVHALGATSLRVRIIPRGDERVALELFDAAGSPVAAVDALVLRSISRSQLAAHTTTARDGLHGIDWQPIQLTGTTPTARDWAELPLAADTQARRFSVLRYGKQPSGGHTAEAVHAELAALLTQVQEWLGDKRFESSTLVVVTSRAVSVAEGEDIADLVHAPGWGLLRSAQTENPGRILLVDTDDAAAWPEAVAAAVAGGEPQLAVRRGLAFAPRLVRADADLIGNIAAIAEPRWRLRTRGRGTLDGAGLSIEEWPEVDRALAPGEVRVGVRATGVNFRDVMIALGVYADPRADIGGEGSGVVLEVAADVTALRPGDRVMGIFEGIGPEVITDHRYLGRFPDSWTFEQAATTSAVFMTAYFGLRDLAGLRSGETLLVHAATGGVGMAAIQLARAWGVEVYVTASPGKQNTLRAMGFDDEHIGNTRTVEFEQKFLAATDGAGMDVVLDSLAREFVDASLRLLPRGGRFLEMGKTDIRDPEQIAAQYPGVRYRAFDLFEAGPDRVREMLAELLDLFEDGTLQPIPVSVWDVRRAPEALRYLSQARHTGKLALRLPTRLNRDGTALITGGTGVLGALFARHLITEHGIRNLLLLSRRGLAADGAAELAAELGALGARVEVVACDTSDRAALDAVLAAISPEHPLTAVLHAAGVLSDTVLTAMTPEQLATALRPKVDAAWNLHLATEHLDLAAFVLFSSAAGQLGSPGQANYAAGNVFLDALAQYRRQRSLPALSLAWGWWADATGMTGHLDERDRARMSRSGFVPMTAEQGLALFDASLTTGRGLTVPARLDLAALRRAADADASAVPSVLRGLVQATRRAAAAAAQSDSSSGLAARLTGLTAAEQQHVVLATVRSVAAAVLGHDGPEAITPSTPFKDLGFDSLGAVEFRNRLQAATGLQLTTTVVFDHATPVALADHIRTQIAPPPPDPTEAVLAQVSALTDHLDQVGGDLGDVSTDQPELAEAITRLAAALGVVAPDLVGTASARANGIGSDLSDEELFALIDFSGTDPETPSAETPPAPEAAAVRTWPLTRYQVDIVAVGLRYPELPLTQVGGYLRISGALDAERMRACVRRSSERHEALRMRVDAAAMTQWISPELPEVEIVDFTAQAEPKRAAEEWMRARTDAVLPLDGPLSEILILVDDDESFVLYGRFHHAVADGWSSALVIRQLCADYLGLAAADLPAPGYLEIVNELQRYRDSAEWGKDRDSLAGQLDGVEPALFPRAATVATHRRHKHCLHFDKAAVDRIRATGRTVFAFTATALAAYLRRIHRDGDIVLGVPMLNRQTPEEFLTVADMVNMLPLRIPVDEDRSVLELSAGTASAVWELQAHQRFPAGDLYAALRERGFPNGSLFDVTYSYVAVPDLAGSEAIGGDTSLLSTGYSLDVVNIVVRDYERDGSLDVDIFYADDVFDSDLPFPVALRQVLRLIETALTEPERPVGEIALLSAEERERIEEFEAGPVAPLDLDATVDQLVAAQIDRTPEQTALVGDGPDGATWSLSYAEFGSRIRGLAASLRGAGLRPEQSVPVILSRGVDSVVAVHAILAAGGAYVPIGVDHPEQRIRELVTACGARVLLAGPEFDALAADLGVHRIDPDPALHTTGTARTTTRSSDLAYVIYTSGSTGVPKGVMIEHLSVVNRLEWMQRRYRLTANDVVLHKTPATFDVSVWELLWWSLTGARAAVLAPGAERDPRALTEAMGRHGVTVLHFVPSMLGPFLDHIAETPAAAADLTALRLVVCSGEALTPALVNRFRHVLARLGLHRVQLANLYGPTEATVDVSYWDLPAGAEWIDRVPIGRPIDNLSLSVLDSRGRRTPIGVPGELNIAGIGVGRGYLGQPEQTLTAFVRDISMPGGTRYRTGDLARWLADGTLEYLGRLDDQIKVRGNRITLGEIENQLGTCPGVTAGVVVDERTADGGITLAAYFVGTATADEVAAHLAQRLPAYMIPSRFHLLEALPLSRSGKVDRRALPSADRPAAGIVAPRTDIEREFAQLWARVLDRDPAEIGVHDDFFTTGGDSILALRLRTAAEQRGLAVDLDELFARPTIADLARAATRRTDSGPAVATALETVPLIDRASLTGVADAFPATALQLGMLFHSLENSESTLYQDVFTYHLRLPWQEEPFRAAYAALLHRHPALRSDFDLTGRSIPLQLVHHSVPSALTIGAEDDLDFDAYVPNAAPLHHLHVTPGDAGITLTLHFHHAILDGWSVATLIRELLQDYLHRIGLPVPAVETASYTPALLAEYARDERAAEQDATARRYWSELLADAVPATIASARPYLPRETRRSGTATLVLPTWLRRGLRDISVAQGVSPKAVLTAAHLLTVRAMSGATDVITGVVSHARPGRTGGDQIAGLFLNTLPLRLRTTDLPSWADTARAVDHQLRASHRYRRFPLRAMIADHGGPLFDTAFNYVDYHGLAELVAVPEVAITEVSIEEQTNFALLVTAAVDPRGDDLVLRVSAGADGITDAQCDEYAQLYSGVLAALVRTPGAPVDLDTVRSGDVLTLVEAAAGRHPGRAALVDDSGTRDYRWLADTSARIASRLSAGGVLPGDRVAVMLDRSPELIATVLGVMRAGAALVPLDPSYPAERREAVLAQAEPARVITDLDALFAEDDALLADGTERTGDTAPDADRRTTGSGEWQPPVIHRDSAAYVLFTSGSTGEPKGVVMRHGALANLIEWQGRAASGAGAVTLQYAPLGFDVSLQEIFSTLAGGGTLRLITEGHRTDPVALLRTVIDGAVQRMYLPFVALQALAEAAVATRTFPSALTALISSGDQLRITPEIRALCAANPGLVLENQYGPTESHVTTAYSMSGEPNRYPALPPIGRPIDGVRVLLLDDRLRPVARGVTGEIYLGGACLAQGYENRAGLTAQRFVASGSGERLYRTGDLGVELPNGELIWLGRGDTQVKVRGYRIECAEVELALTRVGGVEAAAVLPLHRDGVDAVLAAFLVGDGDRPEAAAISAEMRKTLPHYMIPSRYHWLDAIPVMPNGKRDDTALRALAATPRAESPAESRAPADEHERALTEILAEFAGAASISADTSFFEAGGTSVGAMRAAMTIGNRWGVDIPLETFIATPTAAGLATVVRAGGVARAFDPLVPLRTGEPDRAPVFLVHPIGGNVLCYVDLAESLTGRTVYGIQASGIEPGGTPIGDMAGLAAAYIEAIRRVHPDGPYHLAGWSFGGYVALEMARQLPETDLAQVVLLDTISLGDDPVTPIPERDLIVWFFTELLWYAQGPEAAAAEFDTTAATPEELFEAVLRQSVARGIVGAEASPQLIRRLYAVFRANYEATVHYSMTPLDRDIVVLRAEDALPDAAHEAHHRVGSMFDSPTNGWDRWAARELEVIAVPGDHLTMMSRPHVFEVARQLAVVLDRAEIRNAEVGNR